MGRLNRFPLSFLQGLGYSFWLRFVKMEPEFLSGFSTASGQLRLVGPCLLKRHNCEFKPAAHRCLDCLQSSGSSAACRWQICDFHCPTSFRNFSREIGIRSALKQRTLALPTETETLSARLFFNYD